jgi:Tol biopolymer transport system component
MRLTNPFVRLALALMLLLVSSGSSLSQIKVVGQKKITNIENSYPQWSRDGSKVAFTRTRNGAMDIYVLELASSSEPKSAMTKVP